MSCDASDEMGRDGTRYDQKSDGMGRDVTRCDQKSDGMGQKKETAFNRLLHIIYILAS